MGTKRPMGQVIEMKAQGTRARLREACERGTLVRLWRGNLEGGSFTGYVAAVGREYFLLAAIGDYIGFDGYYALRHRDLTELESPDKNHVFIEKAMALKGIAPVLPRDWSLDDAEALVRSAIAANGVVAVHVDTEGDAEMCYVGRILGFEPDGFVMQEITPDAEWLRESSFFGYDEISAIAVKSPYNDALEMVAGAPPEDVAPARGHGARH
ncbi:MAG TPA: hypothetical protein VFZ93_11130 [Albitalea sp.]